ncbi:dienelactone hydrolase family protein [Cohnella sp. GCM10012308]|uniref:dienelactone hydrolase family protein n=1 Tax=Cohnella sp. GCM10012308 TaxID=3317329 RepID=UPI003614B545
MRDLRDLRDSFDSRGSLAGGKRLFDLDSPVYRMPAVAPCPELDYLSASGDIVKALYFRGLDYLGQPTRVFAYMSVPAEASPASPVPAVVLVHGGLGTAFAEWADKWRALGYAAIAIDTEGNKPIAPGSWDYERDDPELAGPKGDPTFSTIDRPLSEQWMYFAVAKALLAGTILRGDDRIDSGKIGIVGISWGGFIASLSIGQDERFAFAVPVYGSGYLQESQGDFRSKMAPAPIASLWDPSVYFDAVKMPTLWLNGDLDYAFSPDATSKSAAATGGSLCLLPDMGHGHAEGWAPSEIYRFADGVTKGGPGLIRIVRQPTASAGHGIELAFKAPEGVVVTEAYVRCSEAGPSYAADGEDGACRATTPWLTVPAVVDELSGTVRAELPPGTQLYYMNIVGTDGERSFTVSSQLVRLEGTL